MPSVGRRPSTASRISVEEGRREAPVGAGHDYSSSSSTESSSDDDSSHKQQQVVAQKGKNSARVRRWRRSPQLLEGDWAQIVGTSRAGKVMYIGSAGFSDGRQVVGLKLLHQRSSSRCDGKYYGERLFRTRPGYAQFAELSAVCRTSKGLAKSLSGSGQGKWPDDTDGIPQAAAAACLREHSGLRDEGEEPRNEARSYGKIQMELEELRQVSNTVTASASQPARIQTN